MCKATLLAVILCNSHVFKGSIGCWQSTPGDTIQVLQFWLACSKLKRLQASQGYATASSGSWRVLGLGLTRGVFFGLTRYASTSARLYSFVRPSLARKPIFCVAASMRT